MKTRILKSAALMIATIVLCSGVAYADNPPPRDPATGQATGKRAHKPIRARFYGSPSRFSQGHRVIAKSVDKTTVNAQPENRAPIVDRD